MTSNKVPKSIQELQPLANEVFLGIINEYNKNGRKFGDYVSQNMTGLIYRCSGSISMLLLVNTFEELARNDDWAPIIVDEFNLVKTYVQENGFDATPFIPNSYTSKIFSPSTYSYTDSVTWVLSFSILVRFTAISGHITISPEILCEVTETIRKCLVILCKSTCDSGGWGFTEGCSEPDLYFSSAVSEALGDLGDYILGESDIAKADEELITELGGLEGELLTSVRSARENLAGWIMRDYLPQLGETMIAPKSSGLTPKDYNTLYFTYFVITILSTTKAAELFFQDKAEIISKRIEHSIYLSRIHLDKAIDTGEDYWIDPDKSSLVITWDNNPELEAAVKRTFSSAGKGKIKEPSLVPLSLRCNILYTYYYAKGEDKKIDQLFSFILKNRNTGNGLWDDQDYVLQITERAVEAIVDYADYLQAFCSEIKVTPINSEAKHDASHPADGMFHKAVKEALREILESPEGIQLITESLPTVTPITQTATVKLSEMELAKLLISLLAQRRQTLQKKGILEKTPEMILFQNLDQRIHEFSLETAADRMLIAAGDKVLDRELLVEKLSSEEKAFYRGFLNWVSGEQGINLGDLFMNVAAESTAKLQKTRRG